MKLSPKEEQTKAMRGLTRTVLITGLLFILGNSCFGQPKKSSAATPNTKAFSAREIAEKFLPSVVLIVCDDGKGTVSQGSGFFLADGKILTNYHVIEGMVRGKVKVAVGGKNASEWWIGRVEVFDKANDIALLSVQTKQDTLDSTGGDKKNRAGTGTPLSPKGLTFATLDRIKAGDEIYVLSNPKGLAGTISRGIVSGEIRKVKGIDLLQIDAPISSGSSGGAVLNSLGEVIGIATGSFEEGQNLNFAVPFSAIVSMLSRLDSRIRPTNPSCVGNSSVSNTWTLCDGLGESVASSRATAENEAKLSIDKLTKRIGKLVLDSTTSTPSHLMQGSIDFSGCEVRFSWRRLPLKQGYEEMRSPVWRANLSELRAIGHLSEGVRLTFPPYKVLGVSEDDFYYSREFLIPMDSGNKFAIAEMKDLFVSLGEICKKNSKAQTTVGPSSAEVTRQFNTLAERIERVHDEKFLGLSGCGIRFAAVRSGVVTLNTYSHDFSELNWVEVNRATDSSGWVGLHWSGEIPMHDGSPHISVFEFKNYSDAVAAGAALMRLGELCSK